MPRLISRPRWHLPESAATSESAYIDRRRLVKSLAAGSIVVGSGALLAGCDDGSEAEAVRQSLDAVKADPSAGLYPVPRNPAYTLDRDITPENLATSYNNYYEFGSSKRIVAKAQALPIRPWEVEIAGLVDKPFTIGVDDLLKKMPLEERLYRHRCVEAWAMAVPWSGFALKELVALAQPKSDAKFLKMVSFHNPDVASGQRSSWYPWPYVEGLSMAEATHDLAFIATGIYGKPMPKQNGTPLRLAVPWKYGFKSSKGIVRFEFTDKRPVTFWEEIQPSEYGFWANVNPSVAHRRWSQQTERLLGSNDRVPTQLYNGYAEEVAHLYKGMENLRQQLFM